jgi:hypothetical protein
VSLQQAVAEWPGKDKSVAPQLKPAAGSDLATALMVYTNDQRVHLLYQFSDVCWLLFACLCCCCFVVCAYSILCLALNCELFLMRH